MRGADKEKTNRSRELRQNATEAEAKLWSYLRGRQLEGHKFVRQEPIGPYFVDFACRKGKLVLELDGPSHDEPGAAEYDAARTKFLEAQGYVVMRFSNDTIFGDLDHVFEAILKHLNP